MRACVSDQAMQLSSPAGPSHLRYLTASPLPELHTYPLRTALRLSGHRTSWKVAEKWRTHDPSLSPIWHLFVWCPYCHLIQPPLRAPPSTPLISSSFGVRHLEMSFSVQCNPACVEKVAVRTIKKSCCPAAVLKHLEMRLCLARCPLPRSPPASLTTASDGGNRRRTERSRVGEGFTVKHF